MIERYSRKLMRDVWTEENKFAAYLKVEILSCEAWSRLGVIPAEDVEKIRANASFSVDRIKEIEEQTRHDVVAFTRAVSESLGEEKKWVHYGLTSTDVVDTANGYLLKQADAILLKDLEDFLEVLRRRALEFRSTPCIGRTHGVHADITSFGLKWALWYEETKRNIERFKYAAAGVEAGKMSGAVGNFANIPPFIQDDVCEQLGIDDLQAYLASKEHLFYEKKELALFVAAMNATHLIILEGISGTGKSSLPRYFSKFIGEEAFFEPIQVTYKEKSDLLGYYNEFTRKYMETPFLRRLYQATYTADRLNLMVLDEMNISRVEYYFADFLSVLEFPEDERRVSLLTLPEDYDSPRHLRDGQMDLLPNTYFIGTCNKDDSTYTVTDKVIDRAVIIDFETYQREIAVDRDVSPILLSYAGLNDLFRKAEEDSALRFSEEDRSRFLDLLAFMEEEFAIALGNRLLRQVEKMTPVYQAIGRKKDELLDYLERLNKETFLLVEYGIESTENRTLKRINRGHTFACTCDAVRRTAERGICVGGHVILGLPGEGREELILQAERLSDLPLTTLKLHQLQLIKGTRMAHEYALCPADFHLYSADEYIELVIDYIEHLRPDLVLERFISQSPRELLLAPDWGLKNHEFTEKVRRRLRERDSWQGKYWKK